MSGVPVTSQTMMVRRQLIDAMTVRLAARGETYLAWDKDAPMPPAARKAYEAELRAKAAKARESDI